jgi:hypothetical protein
MNIRLVFLFLLIPLLAIASVPSFREPVIVQADGVNIVVGLIADPFMVDWDNDGLNDLLVGEFTLGKVSFYKNTGTNQAPVFTFSGYLQADGADISVSYG